MNRVMIDIETLSRDPRGVITQIGICDFSDGELQMPERMAPSLRDQFRVGRRVGQDVVDWWQRQSGDPFGRIAEVSVPVVLSWLAAAVEGADEIWAQGPQFDIVMIESLYRDFGREPPWEFGSVRDSRTLLKLTGVKRVFEAPYTERHNAAHDAFAQAYAVRRALRLVRLAEEGLSAADQTIMDIGNVLRSGAPDVSRMKRIWDRIESYRIFERGGSLPMMEDPARMQ